MESESDRRRLLLPAACFARLWDHQTGGRDNVVMAVYIDQLFRVLRVTSSSKEMVLPPPEHAGY
jgi:hypothetical protein